MKRILSLLLAVTVLFQGGLIGSAAPLDDSKEKIDDSLDMVTYDYITGLESNSTVSTVLEDKSSDSVAIAPAYIPENVRVLEDEISPKNVIDDDNRTKVNPNSFPYSAVMCLRLGQDTTGNGVANSWSLGTGFMVGPKALVTAAHCYWSGQYGWVEECRTYKNQNSSTLGTTYYYPASWQCPTNYTNNQNSNYDWCVVKMQNSIGNQTGYFGYGTGGTMVNKTYTISGYPGDHKYYQYKASGKVSSQTTYICKYNIDTKPGQSGSPVYDSNRTVWAIHTAGYSTYNKGNRITTACYNAITSARNA